MDSESDSEKISLSVPKLPPIKLRLKKHLAPALKSALPTASATPESTHSTPAEDPEPVLLTQESTLTLASATESMFLPQSSSSTQTSDSEFIRQPQESIPTLTPASEFMLQSQEPSSTPVSVIETKSISKEIIFFGLFIIFLCYQIGTIALAIPLVAMVLFLKERPIHPKFPIMGKFTSIFAGLWDIYSNPHFKKTLDDKGNYRTSLSLKHSFSRLPLIGRFVKRDGVLEAYSDAITAEKEAKNAFFSYCTISIMLIIIIEAIILQRYPPFLGIGTANLLSQGNADVSAILVLTNLIRTLILYCFMGYCLLNFFLLVFRKEAMRKL
jgi:hypothetical protein